MTLIITRVLSQVKLDQDEVLNSLMSEIADETDGQETVPVRTAPEPKKVILRKEVAPVQRPSNDADLQSVKVHQMPEPREKSTVKLAEEPRNDFDSMDVSEVSIFLSFS